MMAVLKKSNGNYYMKCALYQMQLYMNCYYIKRDYIKNIISNIMQLYEKYDIK